MGKQSFFILIFVIIIIVGLTMGYIQKQPVFAEVVIGDKRVQVELADTPEKRQKGLGDRASLNKDYGMLFIFNMVGDYGIWMKDMSFPIDIFWIKDNIIVDIAPNIDYKDQRTTYRPRDDANYVLEVNAGFMEENSVKIGDRVDINF